MSSIDAGDTSALLGRTHDYRGGNGPKNNIRRKSTVAELDMERTLALNCMEFQTGIRNSQIRKEGMEDGLMLFLRIYLVIPLFLEALWIYHCCRWKLGDRVDGGFEINSS
ncbi:UNVERIFIED_CONTAM: hypothetical protein Slati_4247600 [Sesamum latifolium]|uniref:Uncharacterized protein n=1 Tax=Sesamum latifolium TaxID=2727402 RepID=A0AAW2TCC3_9LAMI